MRSVLLQLKCACSRMRERNLFSQRVTCRNAVLISARLLNILFEKVSKRSAVGRHPFTALIHGQLNAFLFTEFHLVAE